MHELAVCQALIDQVEGIARERQARRITSIIVRNGPLSGVVTELLQQAFTLARAGTVAAEASLLVETLPVRVRCSVCSRDSEVSANRLVCDCCGDWRTELLSGDELLLARVELAGIPKDRDATPIRQAGGRPEAGQEHTEPNHV